MNARPPPAPPASQVDVGSYTRQARAYEPDDPALRKKRVRRFQLAELERVPRELCDVHKALLAGFPEGAFEPGFTRKIRDILTRYTQMDIDLWLHGVRVVKRGELRALVPGTAFIAVVGMAPLAEKLLVEVDLRFVYRVVDKLLGGNGVAIDIHRPLTEIEQGVFSYVLLKTIALFQGEVVSPEQVALRLEDMRHDLRSCADILRHEELWVAATWKMNFDLDVGAVRAFAPASLARHILVPSPPGDAAVRERVHRRIRRRMARLTGVSAEAWVEAGRIELSREDLRALDPGDIVLLESTQIQLQDGIPIGPATMLIGLGRRGVLHGQVECHGEGREGQRLVFQVTQIEIAPTPAEHDPRDLHGQLANPEDVIAEYEDGANDDGSTGQEDSEAFDEDYGLDDENEGEDEEYAEDYQGDGYQEGEQGYEQQQGYGQQGGGGEEIAVDDNDNLAEAEQLLGDIPIAVVVELGRVQLTADEVIRLRAGQIIELGRSPSDPVDLVVAGKLLAKGELVEIEGSLGVKILNLVKETDA